MSWLDTIINTTINAGIPAAIEAVTTKTPVTNTTIVQTNTQEQNADVSPVVSVEQTDTLSVNEILLPYQQGLLTAQIVKTAKEAEALEQDQVTSAKQAQYTKIALVIGGLFFAYKLTKGK